MRIDDGIEALLKKRRKHGTRHGEASFGDPDPHYSIRHDIF